RRSRMRVIGGLVMGVVILLSGSDATALVSASDIYRITMKQALHETPVSGRLVLFLIDDREVLLRQRTPLGAPFFESPQPIASIAVESWEPGEVVEIPG